MRCYHQASINPQDALEDLIRWNFGLVSFEYPDPLETVQDISAGYLLDSGAFSKWRKGEKLNIEGYLTWVESNLKFQNFDGWFIPDVIDGSIDENDELLLTAKKIPFGIPVFHLHEPLSRLDMLFEKFNYVALGSSGQYASPGTTLWWERMCLIWPHIKGRVHGLRMMSPEIFSRFPFASVDSANIARNWFETKGGIHHMKRRLYGTLPAKEFLNSPQIGLFDAI